jgi:formylglycine-generating enzyme required for sulfatase activity
MAIVLFVAVLCWGTGCRPGDPLAGFTMDRTTGTVPLTVQFTDQSRMDKAAYIQSWAWDFGDGDYSNSANPSHTYTTPGTYSPRLTVTTNRGRSNVAAPSTPITALASPVSTDLTINLPGGVPLVLVRVPAGSFMLGSPAGERGAVDFEMPQYSVNIGSDFYMGKYEVTQAQWMSLMGAWPRMAPTVENGLGSSFPAYAVSWNDARDFFTALNTHIMNTGQGNATMRLPSEAEWEYSCRAGTATRFFFGDSLDCGDSNDNCAAGVLTGVRTDYLWYMGNVSPGGAKAVGTKQANQFGLFDMSGNVYEWVEDDFHYGYAAAPIDGRAWTDSPRAAYRVIRGGSYIEAVVNCRSASRSSNAPENWFATVGFRVARNY